MEDKDIMQLDSDGDLQANSEGIVMEYSTEEYQQVVNYLSNQQTISICILVALGLLIGIVAFKSFGDWFK